MTEQDMWMAINCRGAFIGSHGSFSWFIAYLSLARHIILPLSRTETSCWAPTCNLFIDDDKRIIMLDLNKPETQENAITFRNNTGLPAWRSCLQARVQNKLLSDSNHDAFTS